MIISALNIEVEYSRNLPGLLEQHGSTCLPRVQQSTRPALCCPAPALSCAVPPYPTLPCSLKAHVTQRPTCPVRLACNILLGVELMSVRSG